MTLLRLRSHAMSPKLWLGLLLLVCITPLSCGPKPGEPTGGAPTGSVGGGGNVGTDDSYKRSPHLALGNPSGANENDQDNYLIIREQYALSYNNSAGHANWVSWNLKSDDLGTVDRGQFQPDQSLPPGFTQVTPRDYTRSGYDRGHLCPSGDRTATPQDNDATFLMTNIIPQASGNNQGPWKQLEDESRSLARTGLNLCIVAGGGGGKSKTIGRGNVDVPAFTWKVIAILPPGKQAPQAINETTRVIAVRMPNISTIRKKDWRGFRVSPKEIQDETGYQFFTTVAPQVREVLLNRVDSE